MKKYFVLLLSIVVFISCDSATVDLDDENYVFDGRGGVKCDINGVELKPKITLSPGPPTAELRFESYRGEEYLTLNFYNRDENDEFTSVRMIINDINPNKEILEGMRIELSDNNIGSLVINNQNEFTTNLQNTGTFEIIYHDQFNRILAGRFSYDAINSDNENKEIRNGEFDMKY